MSIDKAEAIVLRKRDFRETSIIVDFYTREFGKVNGLLKGIRKEPVKFASTVEPFSLNEIIFYRKRNSSLHLVSQCDLKEAFTATRQDMVRAVMATLLMELVAVVMPLEDKNEEIFDLALNTLRELEISPHPDKIMIICKIKILSLSGFKPHFDSCVFCGAKILNQSKFSLSSGGLLCPKCSQRDSGARQIFRGTIATILHIERNSFRSNLNLGMNPQVKKELTMVLNAFLNFHLEKELKSERVLNKIKTDDSPFVTRDS